MANQTVCKHSPIEYSTKCAIRKTTSNGKEVVVPTFDPIANTPCTAIFDIDSSKWKKVVKDERKAIIGGHVMSTANQTTVLYLGGFDSNGVKLNTIYELKEGKLWEAWRVNLPLPIGNETIIPITTGQYKCKKPSYPNGSQIFSTPKIVTIIIQT